MKKIGVIGGGSWGTALAILLSENGHEVHMWMRDKSQKEEALKLNENKKYLPGIEIPKKLVLTNDILEAIQDKDLLVLAIPSHGVRELLNTYKNYIKEDQIIVNVAKGIENDTLLRISQIVDEILPKNSFAILYGPSHAEEVGEKMPTTVVSASIDEYVAKYVQDVFMSSYFRVYTSSDVIGVELGGSLKNVIALGAGISDGLGYGDNTKAALMTRGIIEISRLGAKMGAKNETFTGLAGIGDLIVTCTSMHSRNRRAGFLIGEGQTMDEAIDSIGMVVEGIKTTKSAYQLAKSHNISMPITEEIYEILYKEKEVRNSVINLMLRDKKEEMKDIIENKIKYQ